MSEPADASAPLNVLFLCTGNSARSILAEAMANYAPITGGKFRAFSAGSRPKGTVDPLAIEFLQQARIPTKGLRSKDWSEFAAADAPRLDFVFTVCDQAAAEQCPFWPGQPMTAHWGVPDPAAVTSSEADRRRAFRDAALLLRRRIELFASLPLDKLTRLALQARLDDIGGDSSTADVDGDATAPPA
jgi:arsenate reductase